MTKVFSLGGSLVAPEAIDEEFLKAFHTTTLSYLMQNSNNRLILVVGGGAPARHYQAAARSITTAVSNAELDWIGIAATKLNAQLVKTLFADLAPSPVVDNPQTAHFSEGRVLVASGWKPGFSSDYDAVILATRFGADQLINLSNIDYLYTADPRKDSTATAIKNISWPDFRLMVGDVWSPGANLPFDPIAAKLAMEKGLKVIITKGSNMSNINNLLNNCPYEGTTIG